jgi:hypothetical protein
MIELKRDVASALPGAPRINDFASPRLFGVFGQFAPLLSEVQINLPSCRIRSCHGEPLASPFSGTLPPVGSFAHNGRGTPDVAVASPQFDECLPPEQRNVGVEISARRNE